jgi:hypothetical protein
VALRIHLVISHPQPLDLSKKMVATTALNKPKVMPDLPPQVAMLQMIGGLRISRCLYVAAVLGIADRLVDAPQTAE